MSEGSASLHSVPNNALLGSILTAIVQFCLRMNGKGQILGQQDMQRIFKAPKAVIFLSFANLKEALKILMPDRKNLLNVAKAMSCKLFPSIQSKFIQRRMDNSCEHGHLSSGIIQRSGICC